MRQIELFNKRVPTSGSTAAILPQPLYRSNQRSERHWLRKRGEWFPKMFFCLEILLVSVCSALRYCRIFRSIVSNRKRKVLKVFNISEFSPNELWSPGPILLGRELRTRELLTQKFWVKQESANKSVFSSSRASLFSEQCSLFEYSESTLTRFECITMALVDVL